MKKRSYVAWLALLLLFSLSAFGYSLRLRHQDWKTAAVANACCTAPPSTPWVL